MSKAQPCCLSPSKIPGNSRLRARAPWLPPTTNTRSGPARPSNRPRGSSRAAIAGRTFQEFKVAALIGNIGFPFQHLLHPPGKLVKKCQFVIVGMGFKASYTTADTGDLARNAEQDSVIRYSRPVEVIENPRLTGLSPGTTTLAVRMTGSACRPALGFIIICRTYGSHAQTMWQRIIRSVSIWYSKNYQSFSAVNIDG